MENLLMAGFFILWVVALLFFRFHRIWLPFYLTGAVGLAFLLIFVGRSLLPIEALLERYVALNVHQLASLIDVETKVFPAAPGALMVLVISQDIGWTVVQVTVECSALLESAVLMGMLSFYPTWSIGKKIVLAAIGVVATYLANLVRLLLIVSSLHWVGKDSLFIAHTILGRAIFFVFVIFIFWFIITQPTLRSIKQKLQRELAG